MRAGFEIELVADEVDMIELVPSVPNPPSPPGFRVQGNGETAYITPNEGWQAMTPGEAWQARTKKRLALERAQADRKNLVFLSDGGVIGLDPPERAAQPFFEPRPNGYRVDSEKGYGP